MSINMTVVCDTVEDFHTTLNQLLKGGVGTATFAASGATETADAPPVEEKKAAPKKAPAKKAAPKKAAEAKDEPKPYLLSVPKSDAIVKSATIDDFVDAFSNAARDCDDKEELGALLDANEKVAQRINTEEQTDALAEMKDVLAEVRSGFADDTPEGPDDDGEEITADMVRDRLKVVMEEHDLTTAADLLKKYKAKDVSSLDEEHYGAIMNDADALDGK